MTSYHENEWEFEREGYLQGAASGNGWKNIPTDMLDGIHAPTQLDDLAAQIGLEGQARVALAGLSNAGKSVLYNRIRGWEISRPSLKLGIQPDLCVEAQGMFVLADLPEDCNESPDPGAELLLALGNPALVIYVLDASAGVRAADFRWVAVLRAAGMPVEISPLHQRQGRQVDSRRRHVRGLAEDGEGTEVP